MTYDYLFQCIDLSRDVVKNQWVRIFNTKSHERRVSRERLQQFACLSFMRLYRAKGYMIERPLNVVAW